MKDSDVIDADYRVVGEEPPPPPLKWWQGWRLTFNPYPALGAAVLAAGVLLQRLSP